MIIESSTLEPVSGLEALSGFESLYIVGARYQEQARGVVAEAMAGRRARRIALIAGGASTVVCVGTLISILMLIDSDLMASIASLRNQKSAVLVPLSGVAALALLTVILIVLAIRQLEDVQRACRARINELGYPLNLAGRRVTATMTMALARKVGKIQSDMEVLESRIAALEAERVDLQRFRSISSDGQRELRGINAQLTSLERSRAQMEANLTVLLDPQPADLTLAA